MRRRSHHRHVVAGQLTGIRVAQHHGRRGALPEPPTHGPLLGVRARAAITRRLNLCAEGEYSGKKRAQFFGGRYTHYCIQDHNPCSLSGGARAA